MHTLANYLRQTGAHVDTWRFGFSAAELDRFAPDLAVLSPGPGTPRDFDLDGTIGALREREIPLFGVCLGLQGLVEFCGGRLATLDYPMHGKPTEVIAGASALFEGLPARFRAARYHSLYASPDSLPAELRVVARSDDGVVMAVEHDAFPAAAVPFHPESILTGRETGIRLLENAIRWLCRPPTRG